ncbi:MAG: methyltransferase domain-containing protein [Burkholderiales bacterium]
MMPAARPAVQALTTVSLALWLWAAPVRSADVPYVPTPWNVVEAMLKLAAVGPNDFLIDLGSGDGRIVTTAAKRIGTRGFGVDLDDNLVRTARRNAEREGVTDRAAFYTRNLFDTDLSKATVISMYLFNSVNLRLRPSLFQLKPGTRLVSHDFDMGKWNPDERLSVEVPDKSYGPPSSEIFLWIVPADASGRWRWQLPGNVDYDATFDQTFQVISGNVQVGGRGLQVRDARVRGESVSFTVLAAQDGRAVRQEFSGRLMGDAIEGRVMVEGVQTPWRATRSSRGRLITDI